MEPITITLDKETISEWHFTVSVGQKGDIHVSSIVLDKAYWEELTEKRIPPQTFIFNSFMFLLEHEKKEAILSSFNVREIENYFPTYRKIIRKSISS